MKKTLLLLAAIVCAIASNAQDTKLVFGSPTIAWFGLDFTKAKMVGFTDSPHKIRDEYFSAWNASVDMDLSKAFQKKAAYKDPNGINKANLARETETLVSTDDKEMSAENIAENVKQMPTGQKKEGLGVLFIVQSFNKVLDVATVHITFFDIATRKVLWTKKVTGKPSGGSPKSAWTGAIKNIIDKIEKKEFSAWKKEANY